ncbi:hypothetical protein [Tessaracoccus antarcticus]|uniref:Fenitrothion hydrolase n=1 Tax=Tessaracoccus antarcticus TaxID=2479848 RepID=A0A3M0G4V2_9ACTN|nr:hypothetical protein [Tessaracoccus antarcticus]RMB60050.1 hypothetical protein EAX62_10100 [Tessaracoccus antarcticus]
MIPLHGIASREDLPLPFPLIVTAAALVLVVTFWILLFAWREPRYRNPSGRELPRLTKLVDSPWVSRPLRLIVGLVWLVAAAALVFGPDRTDNPIFGFVFVWLWVGLVPIALLFGEVHRRTNPIRLLLRGLGGTAPAPRTTTKSRLPAAAALLTFAWFELVEPLAATLPVLRGAAAAWVAWVVVGTLVTSTRWIAMADPFEAFASTVARMSPWARSRSGQLLLINPLRNLASWNAPRHLSILTCVLLGSTLFDAIAGAAWWVRAFQDSSLPPRLVGTIGLVATVALVTALFHLSVLPLRRAGRSLRETADALSPGLVPLVAGYFLAHYATMLYLEGQRTAIRMADPLALGWDWFGIAEAGPDLTLLAFPTLIAFVTVLFIVGGHVMAALVSHDIALRDLPAGVAVRRQVPLLVFMVVLTIVGMLLMFG